MMMTAGGKRGGKTPEEENWTEWKPVWGGPEQTPHDLQERQAPTETVLLRATEGRSLDRSRRRIVDARLWDAMTPAQQDAALEIAKIFETISRGLGVSATDWSRIPGARGRESASDVHARLVTTYVEWTKRCHRQKISHAMIVDVLCLGVSLAKSDRDRRIKKGKSRINLLKGLSLYCALRGWSP